MGCEMESQPIHASVGQSAFLLHKSLFVVSSIPIFLVLKRDFTNLNASLKKLEHPRTFFLQATILPFPHTSRMPVGSWWYPGANSFFLVF